MEKTGFMVALAVTLCACGSVDDSRDAGSDAQAGDGGFDVAVSDGGAQCDGMPDLSPCVDGLSHTTDACIGGECVGRTCSNVDTRCNTTRLTLDGCEGVPANEGEACNDQDPFTTNDECTAGACVGDPCLCPPGEPCCNNACGFLGVETLCEWSAVVACTAVCGGTATYSASHRRCSGSSPSCDSEMMTETETANCAAGFICEPGTLQGPQDDRFGCLASPACD